MQGPIVHDASLKIDQIGSESDDQSIAPANSSF
jgi:hypothetical protein